MSEEQKKILDINLNRLRSLGTTRRVIPLPSPQREWRPPAPQAKKVKGGEGWKSDYHPPK